MRKERVALGRDLPVAFFKIELSFVYFGVTLSDANLRV